MAQCLGIGITDDNRPRVRTQLMIKIEDLTISTQIDVVINSYPLLYAIHKKYNYAYLDLVCNRDPLRKY